MNIKTVCVAMIYIGFISCGNRKESTKIIKNDDLIVKKIEIISEKTYKGKLLGVSWDRNEAYVCSPVSYEKYSATIVDMEKDQIIKSRDLPIGDMQSPTYFYNPSFMAYAANRYYIIDQFHKILVYDQNLTYLYTKMFKEPMTRHFIDFFSRNDEVFFLIGKRGSSFEGEHKTNCSVEEYQLTNAKIIQLDRIFRLSHESNYYSRATRNVILGMIWSSDWGFEKDGKIYFGNGAENRYRVSLLSG